MATQFAADSVTVLEACVVGYSRLVSGGRLLGYRHPTNCRELSELRHCSFDAWLER